LAQAISVWNESSRTDADYRLMATSLQGAIRTSMPGSKHPLPPQPLLGRPPTQVLAKAEPLPSPKPPSPKPLPSIEPRIEKPKARIVQRVEKEKDFWTDHPATQDLPDEFWPDDPFRDDPLPSQALPSQSTPVASHVSQTSDARSVRINLAELAARIRGYREELRNMEARLMDPSQSTAVELSRLSAELDELVDHRQLLDLYLESLSPAERISLPPLPSADPVLQLLAQRMAE